MTVWHLYISTFQHFNICTSDIYTFVHLYISTDSLYADAARIGSRNARLSVARAADPDLLNGQRGEAGKMRPEAGCSGDQDLPRELPRAVRFCCLTVQGY